MSELHPADRIENLDDKISEEHDYLSDLPDSIIHHILSFLPSTKQAIRTGTLSKRWKHQWTHVPVLVFKASDFNESFKSFSMAIIEHILSLYQCMRIRKFKCFSEGQEELQLCSVTHFAAKRNVEELILKNFHLLPPLLFDDTLLVQSELCSYRFAPNERVRWECLKLLKLEGCSISAQGLTDALSSCLLLEKLKLTDCQCPYYILAIASNSLQKVELSSPGFWIDEISCPNLQKLSCEFTTLYGEAIQNISSGCPVLKSLELHFCDLFGPYQIAVSSESLKRLVLREILLRAGGGHAGTGQQSCPLPVQISQISCPKLEELVLCSSLEFLPCAVMNFPLLVFASLTCVYSKGWEEIVLQQLKHVKELAIVNCYLVVPSNTELARLSSPFLVKSLKLEIDCSDMQLLWVPWALQNCRVLEELAVHFTASWGCSSRSFIENCWNSSNTDFGCLASHLRTVKIISFSEKNELCKPALVFIEFLLKNGRVLEKLVVRSGYRDSAFRSEVYDKVLSFERCNKHVVLELS